MDQSLSLMTSCTLVCSLKKSLNGLKQVPQSWKIDWFFLSLGFQCCESDHNLYVLHDAGNTLIVVVHVDALVLIGNNFDFIFRLKC